MVDEVETTPDANQTPAFALAPNGTLAYVPRLEGTGQRTLVWVDRNGQEESLGAPPAAYTTPAVSRDGSRVALGIEDRENTDVWMWEVARGTLSRVTSDPARDRYPVWYHDGQKVVFESNRERQLALFSKSADGTGEVERLMTSEHALAIRPYSWTPDAQQLLFFHLTPQREDIGLLSISGEGRWEPTVDDGGTRKSHPDVSPDGRWLAYASTDSGEEEVYIQQFPALGARQLISTGGGNQPLWSPDGTELFYRSLDGTQIMAVQIDLELGVVPGNPALVFEGTYFNTLQRSYDIAPDGQRFLMIKPPPPEADTAPRINVILNWAQELGEGVPTN